MVLARKNVLLSFLYALTQALIELEVIPSRSATSACESPFSRSSLTTSNLNSFECFRVTSPINIGDAGILLPILSELLLVKVYRPQGFVHSVLVQSSVMSLRKLLNRLTRVIGPCDQLSSVIRQYPWFGDSDFVPV